MQLLRVCIHWCLDVESSDLNLYDFSFLELYVQTHKICFIKTYGKHLVCPQEGRQVQLSLFLSLSIGNFGVHACLFYSLSTLLRLRNSIPTSTFHLYPFSFQKEASSGSFYLPWQDNRSQWSVWNQSCFIKSYQSGTYFWPSQYKMPRLEFCLSN